MPTYFARIAPAQLMTHETADSCDSRNVGTFGSAVASGSHDAEDRVVHEASQIPSRRGADSNGKMERREVHEWRPG